MSSSQKFWNDEYRKPAHLTLSDEPAEDMEKFIRWLARRCEKDPQGTVGIERGSLALDLGCGNGRNLVYLAKTFGIKGVGYDISSEAISQCERMAKDGGVAGQLTFVVRSIEGVIDLPDNSVDLVLDMMTSHFLDREARVKLLKEVVRVLKPAGWFFFKTFCSEGDLHVNRLLRESPASEKGSYIHPRIGVAEHTWTEGELEDFFREDFEIHKVEKSHKHLKQGQPFKRRTMSAYLEKKW